MLLFQTGYTLHFPHLFSPFQPYASRFIKQKGFSSTAVTIPAKRSSFFPFQNHPTSQTTALLHKMFSTLQNTLPNGVIKNSHSPVERNFSGAQAKEKEARFFANVPPRFCTKENKPPSPNLPKTGLSKQKTLVLHLKSLHFPEHRTIKTNNTLMFPFDMTQ